MSGLRPCGCAFCQPVNSSSLSSSSLEQEQVITTPTLRITATGTGETIDISTDVTTFAGSADGNITIQEANTISLGETTPGTSFPNVSSTSGSITVTAAGRITANNVQATDLTNGAINFTSTGSGVTLGAINTQTTTVNANGDVNDVIDLQVTGFLNLVGGNGYTPSSTTIPVTFSASPTGDTATGMATSDGVGVITGITIANPGSGYTTTPTIVIDAPTTGDRATATAVTTGGNRVITSPTLVVDANGSPILLSTNSHVVDTLSATSDTFTRATGTATLGDAEDDTTTNDPDTDTTETEFTYSFNHVNESTADDYLVLATGMNKYSEWQADPLTYWGPASNEAEGTLVYKFPFTGTTTSASLYTSSIAWDFFNEPGGNGRGASALEVSKDGLNWTSLHNNLEPRNWGGDWTFDDSLPAEVLDASDLWIRLRFYQEDSPTNYAVAQFGRSTSTATTPVFSLNVTTTTAGQANASPAGEDGPLTAPNMLSDAESEQPDTVGHVVITNGASGYSPNATNIPVTFEASPTGDTATGYATADAGGVVTGVTITNPGSGYTTAPTITFSSTVHALVTATLGTDEVASAAVDFSGLGYTPLANIPVTFEASPTSDTATGYATTDSNGEIVSLTITHFGSGYVSAPLVVVDPPATSGNSLLRGNIEFKATNGLITDTVVGKNISLTADDTVTDLNYIIGEALTVTSLSGKDITLANLNNQIAAFGAITDDSAGTKGDVTLTSTLQDVTLTGIIANNIDILVNGNVNDSGATDGTTLNVIAGGIVELDTPTNDIDTLTVGDTAVDTVTINNGGSGYTPGTVAVTFAPPPITNIVINTPGSGYATNADDIPVTFDMSPTGDTATGVASSDGTGQITSVTITNPGSGYTSTPTLTISAPTTGTRAEASISDDVTAGFATADSSGVIVSITTTNPGSGYLSAPSLVIDPPTSGTQATATATNLLPSAVTFVDADDLNVTGIVAGAVTLQTGTQLTQTGAIKTGTLSVTSGATLNLTNTENDADVISITNTGFDATIYDVDDLQIGDPGITANNVVFEIAGDLTQESSSSILVTDLRVIGSRGEVSLTSTTNEIATISVAGNPNLNQQVADVLLTSGGGSGYTPDQTDIPVVFDLSPTGDTATGYATADATGTITTITITSPGSGYDSVSPPTATVTAPADPAGTAPTVSVVLASQDITIVNSIATAIGSQGLQSAGSAVSITSTGALTQSGDIISKSLSAISDADIVLTNTTNNVDEFSGVSTTGDVSYTEFDSVNIAMASGSLITFNANNSLTQTGAVTGTTLKITGASDVTFTSPDNDVDTIEASGIFSNNGSGFGLEYVDQDDLTVNGVAATAGSISITSGDTLTIDSTVVAGTAIANDGDILLEAQDGNLEINADITSEADTTTLKAVAGLINHNSGTITTETLIWYATVSPTFGTLIYSIEGPNLTGPGDLIIDRTGSGAVEIAGASVVNGNVSIVADSLILSELVRAAGTGNEVVVQTNTGSIDIQGNGRLESESGDILVAAATDFIVSNHALDLNGDPTVVTATATAGTLVIKKPTATATATLNGDAVDTSVTVDFGGLGYTPSSTSIPVTFSASPTGDTATGVANSDVNGVITSITVTHPGSGYTVAPTITIDGPTSGPTVGTLSTDVQKIDVTASSSLDIYEANAIELVDVTTAGNPIILKAGGVTQSGTLIASNLLVMNTAGDVVLDQNNDNETVVIINTVGDVTYNTNRTTETDIASIQGVNVDLDSENGFSQSGAITATSLDVTNTVAGDVVLNQNNDVATVTISNAVGDVTYNTNRVGSTATATATLNGDAVDTSVTVDFGGLGYTPSSTTIPVTFSASPTGDTATGVANSDINGVITSITVTHPGSGYTIAPTTTIGDPLPLPTDIAGIQGVNVDLDSENGFTQSGAIIATSLDVTNTVAGDVVLDQNNDVATVAITNTVGDVTYNTNHATTTDIAGIQGVNVDLDSENGITQSAAITATSLDVTNTVDGDVVLDQNNDVATVAITNTVGDVTYTTISSSITDINGIQGVNIALNSDNGVSQSAAITATNSLTVTNAVSGNVVLDQNNDVATVAFTNTVGDVTYNTNRATATDIAGIQGLNVDLNSENGFTQSGAITATSLDVTNTVGGDVVLANASNDVDSLSVINTGRSITYFDSDDLIVTQLDGNPIAITAGGSVSQVNDISGVDLTVTANGMINLSNPNNSISTVALSSSDNDISFFNNKSVVIAAPGIDAGTGNIEMTLSDGDLSQVGQLIGSSLVLAITDGDVTLLNTSNDVDEIAALLDGTGRSISFTDTDDLIIGGSNAIQGIVGENIVNITSGGDLAQTKNTSAGTLNLNAGGDYSQTGSTNVTGDVDIDATGAITQTGSTATIDAANLDMNAGT
ncbi:MAG: hypothetical protein ACR2NI_01700, partial [Pirellulales bacterium]